jgi:hypothetical protein
MHHIRKRGNLYICIIPVPKDLQYLLGPKQIWKSLNTLSYKTAKTYAKRFIYFIDEIFLRVQCNIRFQIW